MGFRRKCPLEKKYQQLVHRHAAPFVRDVLKRFRADEITAQQGAGELQVSARYFYRLWRSYLQAVARRTVPRWSPKSSGGNRRKAWPAEVLALLHKLLSAKPPLSYSFAASEVLRRQELKIDRASIRRWALKNNLAPDTAPKKKPQPTRRWQVQNVGQLWQYDASPHRWLGTPHYQPTLLQLIDDHSRVLPGARLYDRENLPAHLDFLAHTFATAGLPLCLYVDYHSFFFTHTPDALTQLGSALKFYEVSLRYAPTPQAKGKIERAHHFWQNRLPALFAAEKIATLQQANPLLEALRRHHNAKEIHRELKMTPQAAWNRAKKAGRFVLRPAPKCPWWPYVWSVRTVLKVGDDGRVPVGSQRLRLQQSPGAKVVRCQHWNGDVSILLAPPTQGDLPKVLLHCPA